VALPLFREHHKGAPLQRQERRAKVVGLKLHHTNRTRRRPVGERAFLRLAAIGFIGALALSLTNVGGLLEGSEVRYRGFSVGTVEKVDPGVEKAKVTLLVKKNVKIPRHGNQPDGLDRKIWS